MPSPKKCLKIPLGNAKRMPLECLNKYFDLPQSVARSFLQIYCIFSCIDVLIYITMVQVVEPPRWKYCSKYDLLTSCTILSHKTRYKAIRPNMIYDTCTCSPWIPYSVKCPKLMHTALGKLLWLQNSASPGPALNKQGSSGPCTADDPQTSNVPFF